jgi:hypothetical protein
VIAKAATEMSQLHQRLRDPARRFSFDPDSDPSEERLFDILEYYHSKVYSTLPSGKLNDEELKQMKKTGYGVPSRLTYLFSTGQPSGFSRLDYLRVRREIINGNSHLTEHCT